MKSTRSVLVLLVLLAAAAIVFAQSAPEKPKEKTAAEAFKNVQVMKDVPAPEWFPTMQFIAGSLGVSCHHCHIDPFASDEKPAKQKAREMMRMVAAINQQNFAGMSNRVTCDTCHRGSTKPAKAPTVAQAMWMPEFLAAGAEKPAAPAAAPALPEAQAVLAKYRAAVGAAANVRSRYYKGTVTIYEGSPEGPRVFEQVIYLAGDQVRVDLTDKQGTQSSIYDGRRGWVVTPKGTETMSEGELASLRTRILGPLKIDALPESTQATTKAAEEFRGHQTWVVELTLGENKTESYLFDQQSGLLLARRGSLETAFGKVPEETWYDDYRDFEGVKLPLTITSAGVTQAQSRRYDEIQINLPIDPARFAPPAANTGTGR